MVVAEISYIIIVEIIKNKKPKQKKKITIDYSSLTYNL